MSLVQTGLKGLGHDPGPADGLWGPKTASALQSLLAAAGKPVTAPVKPAQTRPGAMIHQGSAGHPVREIIVHCSATRPEWMKDRSLAEKRAEIRRWHVEGNGWKNIGYHWLIDRDGSVTAGRGEHEIGSHVSGHNAGTIGICLIGGHGSAEGDLFARHFTKAQDLALRQLIAAISGRTGITKISGHNQYAAKACPGFNVPKWLKEA
ncbi:peptidoglycan recognition protein family protein [Pseudogemmobacter faecipullorum]|uniref:N-acetylmuramoyl-L-alanine amidase n=1 Tax=Pseudogemmobacter faecipullorum TaxID=2755041 RepID=A0ABS8CRI4_9RHOB|nr:N-acetylmuramoyl-L-alanine amidase [Pseudogemmobacter faecipullorum]MCB5411765.1 N-acetylmuramoyl-L-alanine amidase [Pseudogemmobacter faecipullorum]